MQQLFYLLSTALPRRWTSMFCYLIAATVMCAFLEVLTLSLIVPFVNEIINQGNQTQYSWIGAVFLAIDIPLSPLRFGVFVLALLLISGAARLVLLFATTRFCFSVGRELSKHIYGMVIRQPYWVHTSRNSSEVITNVNVHVNELIFYGLMPTINFLSNSIFVVVLLLGVIYLVPSITLIVILVFGIAYVGYAIQVKQKIKRKTERIARLQVSLTQHIQESLQGIREILLDQSQSQMLGIFDKQNRQLRHDQSVVQFLAQSPRFILETLGMLVLISLCMLLLEVGQSFNQLAGSLALLALGLQRVLPSAQQALQSWVLIQGAQQATKVCASLLKCPVEDLGVVSTVALTRCIEFNDVSFQYQGRDDQILKNLSLKIHKGQRIGILGKSGQGKSTFLDVLMGLQQPMTGTVLVDGVAISGVTALGWRRTVAHVPQHFMIIDGTLLENIAWGSDQHGVDHALVDHCARIAGLAEFIENLPSRYSTRVGERGVLLSGGQRQRLAIARAFYKRSSLIVLDEATSALDAATESEILDSIFSFSRDLTIVMVSHQKEALRRCDHVYEMKDGALALLSLP